MGFRLQKRHFEDGNGYKISKILFENVVNSIHPLILPSLSSVSSDKTHFIDDKPHQKTLDKPEHKMNLDEDKNPILNIADSDERVLVSSPVFFKKIQLFFEANPSKNITEVSLESICPDIDVLDEILDKLKTKGLIFSPKPEEWRLLT